MNNIDDDLVDLYQALHCALDEVNGELSHLGQYIESLAERLTKIEIAVKDHPRASIAKCRLNILSLCFDPSRAHHI